MPTLEAIEGQNRGQIFAVPATGAVLGRDAACQVRLDDARCSRAHAEIRPVGDGFVLADLDSSNGTELNGRDIEHPTRLRDGDEIRLGQTRLRFVLRGSVPDPESLPEPPEPATIIEKMETRDLPLLAEPDDAGRRTDALRFLLDLARAAQETDNLPDLAGTLAKGLADTVPADRYLLLIAQGEELEPVAPPAASGRLAKVYAQPYSRSVVEQAARERVAVLSRLAQDDRFRQARSVKLGGIASAICVPLAAGSELLGALYLDRLGEGEHFSPADFELATAAGLHCAMALLNIRRLEELRASRDRLEEELTGPEGFIGASPALQPVYDFIGRVAPTDAGVLILGESGTGKELVARALHTLSPRADRPCVVVNCAALPESLAEAELFGHERGAFTGADKGRPGKFLAADGGTIFLDEVGELSEPVQAKLLRVLEEGEIMPVGEAGVRRVNVRVVAATNRDLAQEVEAGRFRRDLYFRLNILRVELPPLRRRPEDVALLLKHFVKFFARKCGRPEPKISAEVARLCAAYSWPGNVRELRNAVERMVILARGAELAAADLPAEFSGRPALNVPGGGVGELRPLAEVEREHILGVLTKVDNNKKRAAEVLAIDRSTLYAKLKQYGADE